METTSLVPVSQSQDSISDTNTTDFVQVRAVDTGNGTLTQLRTAGSFAVFVGTFLESFTVEEDVLHRMKAFPPLLLSEAVMGKKAVYVIDDPSNFKFALSLARQGTVDPAYKKSRQAIKKYLQVARKYGLNEEASILADRDAVLQNVVMPEIAGLLETNPRRKLLLLKSVVKKASLMDIVSGGTQSIQSKISRLKVAMNLVEACENPTSTMSEIWKRKYLRFAEKILLEGRSLDTLPPTVLHQFEELHKRILTVKEHKLQHSEEFDSSMAIPLILEQSSMRKHKRAQLLQHKSRIRLVKCISLPSSPQSDICSIDCAGQKSFSVHRDELQRFGIFDLTEVTSFLIFDDPSRFELALHLIRCDGKVEDAEKADESMLKSYRRVARSYGLEWSIMRRLEAWINAHKNGVGGARNASEEIRALRLTRLLNPEKGDALVASALAEAYMERVQNEHMLPTKRRRLLEKAEINLRTVLPLFLTSLSVTRVSKEQQAAIDQSVAVLKNVLTMQDRTQEANELDAAVKYFSQGVQGAAKELSSLIRDVPNDMYA